MRLIDAEHLKRWILARWEKTDPRSEYPLRAIDIIDQLDREDTMEIEPVVKCKDCKHWQNQHLCKIWSKNGTIETGKDDFCSYGERRTDETD